MRCMSSGRGTDRSGGGGMGSASLPDREQPLLAAVGASGSGAVPLPDLEQPLLQPEQQHDEPKQPKQWPTLRLSSVSTRRLQGDAVLPSPTASSMSEASLLSPLRSAALAARRSWNGPPSPAAYGPSLPSPRAGGAQALLSPRGPSRVLPSPFHTVVLDVQRTEEAEEVTGGDGGGVAPLDGMEQQGSKAAAEQQQQMGRYTHAALTGCINAVISLPVMLSFAAIIFRVSCCQHCA